MISTDRNIFIRDSAVAFRMARYGALTQELHIIVFAERSLGLENQQIGPNVWVYPTNSRNRWFYVRDAVAVGRRITRERKINLVTTQDPFEAGLAGMRIAKIAQAQLQVQVHTDFLNPWFLRQSLLNRVRARIAPRVLKAANGIRVVSPRIKGTLLKAFPAIAGRVVVLPIFVDVKRIREHTPTIDLHKQHPQFEQIILVVSRLEDEKNVALALYTFQKVFQKYPKAGFVIAGSGRGERQLKTLAKKLGLEKSAVFVGEQSDIYSYYKTADVLLLTSNYEGYGMVLVEAAAADCPIVTTDVGIARDLMQNSEQEFVCPVGDVECLAREVIRLLKNKSLREVAVLKTQAVLEHLVVPDSETYLKHYGDLWHACVDSASSKS